ncbi:MAG: hypothetical protein CMP11_07975 [Zetaproteobacteria bacterium]|nr:hypothetical protein [Pseudobdellovibrionaceae bacterium]
MFILLSLQIFLSSIYIFFIPTLEKLNSQESNLVFLGICSSSACQIYSVFFAVIKLKKKYGTTQTKHYKILRG